MSLRVSGLAVVLCLAGCGGHAVAPVPPPPPPVVPLPPAPPPVPTVPGHSLDLDAMDRSVKPGDDFFLYANGSWLAKAEIPADRGSAGVGQRLTEVVEKRTSDLLEEAARTPAPETKKVGDYYAAFMDAATIEANGLKPLAPVLRRIATVADVRALATSFGEQLRADVDPLNATHFHTDRVLGLWVEQDLNDSTRYAPYLLQGGLGMPDRSYYLDETPRMAAIRVKYEAHVATLLRLAGIRDAEGKAKRVVALERKLAEVHASRVDSEDVRKANNVWARTDFDAKAPGMPWADFFRGAGLDTQPFFIVWQPGAVAGLAALARSEPLAVWKDYLSVRAIEHVAACLPKAIADEVFAFYATELQGVPTQPPRWKQAVRLTNAALGMAVGRAYVAKYFPPESKQAAEKMVADIKAAFGRRIDGLSWMAPATKAKAREKLETLVVGVGYPDAWPDDSTLTIARDDAAGNLKRAELWNYRRNVAKLGKPIDRGEWAMVPQVVDAVNMPIRNALNFPAGILSAPFFDAKSTAAANYGAIGAIIGHEISHSFDDQGAQFDAHGRFVRWWTPEDYAHFEASGVALAAQYSTYHPLPDATVDGRLTLSENIADLAGLAASYDAWRASLGGQPAPEQDGLTGEQQFFLSFAQGWQNKQREATLRERLKTDGHAPPHYRALTVRNIDAWYGAFDVKPGEAMFLDPAARVRVW
ncbi:MAG: M13 family metallopeptidase [Polyangiaceae bacterium]|jgi:putative endopeptidase